MSSFNSTGPPSSSATTSGAGIKGLWSTVFNAGETIRHTFNDGVDSAGRSLIGDRAAPPPGSNQRAAAQGTWEERATSFKGEEQLRSFINRLGNKK